MEQSPEIIKSTALMLQRNWEIEPGSDENNLNEPTLFHLLCIRIEEMLRNDLNGLVNAMYRLDIPENKFHEAMENESDGLRAKVIARLVLEREFKKAETRLKYKGH